MVLQGVSIIGILLILFKSYILATKEKQIWHPSFCPLHCTCAFQLSSISETDKKTVDCSHGGYTTLPVNITDSVELLDLSANHIREDKFGSFEIFTNLTQLDLSEGHIYSLEELPLRSPTLRYLLLDNNEIIYVPNSSFMELIQLIFLSLANNKIEVMHKDSLRGLTELRTLDLTGNHIFNIEHEWFRPLHSMRKLILKQNNIQVLYDKSFPVLPHMRELDFSSNQLKHLYDNAFLGIGNVHTIHLQNNAMNKIPTAPLKLFRNLTFVDLSNNHFIHIQSKEIQYINVTQLHLNSLRYLQLVDAHAFTNLPYLEHLEITNCKSLIFIDRNTFSNVPKLKQLLLHANNFTSIETELIESLPSLNKISLHSNPFYCDCNLKWLNNELLSHAHNLTFINPEEPMLCKHPAGFKDMRLDNSELRRIPDECPPRILPLFSTNYDTIIGESVVLKCRSVGRPIPQMDWVLPSKSKQQNTEEVYVLRTGAVGKDARKHTSVTDTGSLVIDYIQGSDHGEYSCLVSSPLGRDKRTASIRVKNVDVNVIILNVASNEVTVTWRNVQYSHNYQIVYRQHNSNITYQLVDIQPFFRKYTAQNLFPNTRYEFCIALRHNALSLRINCTTVRTRDKDYNKGVYEIRNYVVGGAISGLMLIIIVSCTLGHVIRRYNKRKRAQEEIYADNLSQMFLASIDSLSDTTPITFENRGAAEMFDDDDIEEIRSTASMGSVSTTTIR